MKRSFLLITILFSLKVAAQTCPCEKEFTYIQNFMEHNYAGFADKLKQDGRNAYNDRVIHHLRLARSPRSGENCLLIIQSYLDAFKDDHVQLQPDFNGYQIDSSYISNREIIPVSPGLLTDLAKSSTAEGIYNFIHDSSYRIAVIKEKKKEHLYDYTGIIIESKIPGWNKGMVKFRAWQLNDSMLKGVLYVRNHLPKTEWFYIGKNSIGGDWQREGTSKEKNAWSYVPVASKKLTDNTLYIKISSFSPSNAKNIDSVFKANAKELETTPNLILDLRDNGGGADFAYTPLVPYVYTNPIKTIGVDVLATEPTIAGWRAILDDEDIPEKSKAEVRTMISQMENNKGKLVNIAADDIDSSFTPLAYPKKVIILINNGCASTTEQFLLLAKQSSKVILAGASTSGTLDYSNMREHKFPCMPYILKYATTRSRRLDIGQGIDNVGIQPAIILAPGTDWIAEAVKIAGK